MKFDTFFNNIVWVVPYLVKIIKDNLINHQKSQQLNIYFCICDHFEPYWGSASDRIAKERLRLWLDEWPKLAERFRDSRGNILKYGFFYPEEEYKRDDLDLLGALCRSGYGEIEVHLHHNNDTADNLRKTLLDYKKRLHEIHGVLPVNANTRDISYAFIHGNWALCNSRSDGRWCGVNNEIDILLETGCYADMTLPSAPSETQTRKINSIYYANNIPGKRKSHNVGVDVCFGTRPDRGLLMVQGPLCLSWRRRKYGFLPRIENSGLMASNPVTASRVRDWVGQRISVGNANGHIFIKLYAHGTQEENSHWFFNGGGVEMFESLLEYAANNDYRLNFVSAREMVNIIGVLEAGATEIKSSDYDSKYILE